MDTRVHGLLADAQTWRALGRLFERPQGSWHDDVGALSAGPIDEDVRRAAALARGATEGGYLASFGPSGVVSPREVGHCGMRDPGQILADLQARYDAFGFRPAAEDPLDHVAVETGFVAFLRLKEAFLAANGQDEPAAIVREAADAFIADHLRDLAAPMAAKLEAAEPPYLVDAARALAARAGTPPAVAAQPVIWIQDSPGDFTCGSCLED